MDWLNWALRAFTIVGGTFAFICFVVGAFSLYTSIRASLELWQAKRRFYKFQKESPEFQLFTRYYDTHNANTKKETPTGRG